MPHLHRDPLQPSNGTAGEKVARGLLNSMWNARHMGSIVDAKGGNSHPFRGTSIERLGKW